MLLHMVLSEFRQATAAFGILSLLIAAACVSDGGSSSGGPPQPGGSSGVSVDASSSSSSGSSNSSGDAGAILTCDPVSEKVCGGVCVRKDDPSYGCTVDQCLGCPEADFVSQFRCDGTTCKIAECLPGRLDCDNRGDTGCEEKINGKHCGECDVACRGVNVCSEVKLDGGAADAGAALNYACTSNCEPGLENCGGACVNLATDEANCGGCSVQCKANRTKGTASCNDRVCVQSCLRGMKLNTTGTECVADRTNCVEGGKGIFSAAKYSEQCCSNIITNAPGFSACTSCAKSGGPCTGRSDCCAGLVCTGGKCLFAIQPPL
jgi:hypothetical protein